MSTWMRTLWNGLLFREEAFTGLRDRRDAFLQGFLIILVVALVIGLPTLVGDLVSGLRPNAVEAELDKAMSEMDQVVAANAALPRQHAERRAGYHHGAGQREHALWLRDRQANRGPA